METKSLKDVEKAQTFNRLKQIILNPDNKLKHMVIIERMVNKFEDEYGDIELSKSLKKIYNTVNNSLKNK